MNYENTKICTPIDPIEECEKLRVLLSKQEEETMYLRNELKSMDTEFSRMRAQLDIVYLIFGRQ